MPCGLCGCSAGLTAEAAVLETGFWGVQPSLRVHLGRLQGPEAHEVRAIASGC